MAETLAKQVASRLRELRTARGFSVRELARRAGVLPEMVSRSERGITEITISTLAKVCVALDVSLPDFFDFARMERTQTPAAIQNVIGVLEKIPPERLNDVARGLVLLLRGKKM